MSKPFVRYIRLQSGDNLPELAELQLFKAILVIEDEVSELWQWELSRSLALSGCRYVMAWGRECSTWEEAVEEASLEAFNYEEIPEEHAILTTSHEDEELSEAFWFARHRANHPAHELRNTLILHISKEDRRLELEAMYEEA